MGKSRVEPLRTDRSIDLEAQIKRMLDTLEPTQDVSRPARANQDVGVD
jgi:hypothetical protein